MVKLTVVHDGFGPGSPVLEGVSNGLARRPGQPQDPARDRLGASVMSTGFSYTTYIEATPERVWRALTDRADTRRFWRHRTAGGKTFPSDWKKGSTWALLHEDVGVAVRDPEQVVLESDPPHRLSYTWHSFTPEWAAAVGLAPDDAAAWRAEPRSKVAFDIEDHGPRRREADRRPRRLRSGQRRARGDLPRVAVRAVESQDPAGDRVALALIVAAAAPRRRLHRLIPLDGHRSQSRILSMLLRKDRSVVSIRHALLALLSEGPKYGLQLRQEFEAKTGEVWPLNVGQVYTTLQRLERDGLVESDDAAEDGPQKGFHITEEGVEELATWLRTPPDFSSPPRDELVIKVLVALGLPGVDVHEVIQVHRRYIVQLMQQWTRLKEDEAGFDIQFALVVDAELFRLDSVVKWLDTADGRLKRAAVGGRRAGPPAVPPPQGPAQGGSEAMSYLELRDISKVYGEGAAEVRALQRIDLSVDAGSLVAVMGASGSGKSTLLTIAGSLEDPTSGEVYVDGRSLSSLSRNGKARLRRQSIGYVFQDYNLLAGLSAVENVSLPLELDGVGGPQGPGDGHGVPRGPGPGRPGRPLPRPAVGWRAPAGRHRPGRGRRAAAAPGRRALRARSTPPTPRPSCA